MYNKKIFKAFVFSLTLSQSFAHVYDHADRDTFDRATSYTDTLIRQLSNHLDASKDTESLKDQALMIAEHDAPLKKEAHESDFHVLCLDGGGTRAVGTLVYLAELEMRTGRQVHELFDHIYGTSTGGLAACLLAYGYKATKVLDIYINSMQNIFARSYWDQITNPMGLAGPMYNHQNLETMIENYMGSLTLGDLKTPVSLAVTHAQTQETTLLSSLDEHTKGISIVNAARATSAAPTYFAAQDINGETYVDGGINANNPVLQAYEDITLNKRHNKRHINIFSVGTGHQAPIMLNKFAGKLGFGSPANIPGYFMSSAQANIHKTMKHVATITPYINYTRVNFDLPYAIDLADVNPKTQNLLMQTAFDHAAQSKDFKSYVQSRISHA